MSVFTAFILILFVVSLCAQWGIALCFNCPWLFMLFSFELVAFGYLCRILMGG